MMNDTNRPRDPQAEVEKPRSEGFLPDAVRRAVISGIQAVFTTEENVRAIVGALVPKDLVAAIRNQVDETRDDALRIVGREIREFLEKLNVGEELRKILTSVSFEIKTEVRFIPNESGQLRPDVKSRVSRKPSKGEKKAPKRG
jgi:hypothetical protein